MANEGMEERLKLNIDDFVAGISKAVNSSKLFKDTAGKDFSAVGASFAVAAGNIMATGITSFFQGLAGSINESIKEAQDAEKSVDNLSSSLKRTGIYTKEVLNSLVEFSAQIQETSLYTDDQALAAMALTNELTSLNEDGIKLATQAAADFAAAMGYDLETANQMIIKSVNGNTTAFNKLGIEIKAGKTDAERLTNTLNALSSMQGAAASKLDNYTGVQNKNNDAVGNFKEELGNIVIKSPLVIAAYELMADSIIALTSVVKSAGQAFVNFQNYLIENQGHIKSMAITVGVLAGSWLAWKTAIIAVNVGFAGFIGYITTAWAAIVSFTTTVVSVTTAIIAFKVAVIAAVVYGLYLLIDNFELVTAYFHKFTADMAIGMSGLIRIFSNDWADALEAWSAKTNKEADKVIEKINNMDLSPKPIKAPFWERPATSQGLDLGIPGITPEQGSTPLATNEQTNKPKKKEIADPEELKRIREHNNMMVNLDAEKNNALIIADMDFYAQKEALENERRNAEIENKMLKSEEDFILIQNNNLRLLDIQFAQQQAELDLKYSFDLAKAQQEQDAAKRQEAIRKANNENEIANIKLQNKKEIEQSKEKIKTQQELDKWNEQNKKDTLSNLVNLQTSSNKELAFIGRAAATFQLGVDGIKAWSAAMAMGPILGPIMAVPIAAGFAIKMAELNGLKFANGGHVTGPGTSTSDSIPASLSNNEYIMRSRAVSQYGVGMMNAINEGSYSGGGDVGMLVPFFQEMIGLLKSGHSININGREIIQVIRDEKDLGRSF